MSTFYKVLGEKGAAHHGGKGVWPLPHGSRPGKWVKVDGRIVACKNGLHFCRPDQLIPWLGPVIYELEPRGEIIDAGDKLVVAEARLVRRCDGWNDRTARLFAVDCATRALNRERKARREPDKRSWNAVKVARRFANGEATDAELAAARDAAWAAARDAARAAAWDAARAAAWAAAWAAARDAAWAAARAAAWAAARDAAWDAERRWQTKRLLEYIEGKR